MTPRSPCRATAFVSQIPKLETEERAVSPLVIQENLILKDGYLTVNDNPSYGIELNWDVARAQTQVIFD